MLLFVLLVISFCVNVIFWLFLKEDDKKIKKLIHHNNNLVDRLRAEVKKREVYEI